MIDKYHILLVEDDESLGYLLSEYLQIKNFKVTWVKTGKETLDAVYKHSYHLIVLDIMLPDIDGFNLAKKLNTDYPKMPFIFLSARSLKVDVLKGFALGAVDYLKKPIDEEELVTRIGVLISRLHQNNLKDSQETPTYSIGSYLFDSKNQLLQHEEKHFQLTPRENELLLFLIKNKNTLCSHKDILDHLWGKNDYFNRKSLNVFISHLRKYLKHDSSISISNLHKKGFVLNVPEE